MNKVYLNSLQAAEYVGYSRGYFYKLVENGSIPCTKLRGKTLRFKVADLDKFLTQGK